MYKLNQTLNLLIKTIRVSEVQITKDGFWKVIPKWQALVLNWLPILKKSLHSKNLQHFIYALEKTEQEPIYLKGSQVSNLTYLRWLDLAEIIRSAYASSISSHQNFYYLLQLEIALLYRLQKINGGLDAQPIDLLLLDKLYDAADLWKSSQKIFWDSNLTLEDAQRLELSCRYPEFIKLLLRDFPLRESFFNWLLRDGIDPEAFIQYPATIGKIIKANLNGRIGRLGGKHLKIKTVKQAKILTLTIEGEDVSILDPSLQITLKGSYSLTIQEIFDIFSAKHLHAGNLEFFEKRIINWNTHCLGWWNTTEEIFEVINLYIDNWWEQLPLFEVLTLQEAKRRYGIHLDGCKWSLVAKASREYLTLNFDKTHAYLEVAIPIGNGYYQVFDFGKFASHFPSNPLETLSIVAVSVPATIAYPDENVYYTHRQHVGYSFLISPEQGKKYMQSIKEDILQSRTNNFVFQIESENCGRWIQKNLEEHLGHENVPNLFQMALIKAEPTGLLKLGWDLIRLLPKEWQSYILALCHVPLGAWKGCWVVDKHNQKIWKALTHSSYWNDGIVYLPSYLHKQCEKVALQEEVGHQNQYFNASHEHLKQKNIPEIDPFTTLDLFEETG